MPRDELVQKLLQRPTSNGTFALRMCGHANASGICEILTVVDGNAVETCLANTLAQGKPVFEIEHLSIVAPSLAQLVKDYRKRGFGTRHKNFC